LKIVPSANFHTQEAPVSSRNTTDQTTDIDLGTYIYLTGFTLGHDYEWSMEVDTTINWLRCRLLLDLQRQTVRGFQLWVWLAIPDPDAIEIPQRSSSKPNFRG